MSVIHTSRILYFSSILHECYIWLSYFKDSYDSFILIDLVFILLHFKGAWSRSIFWRQNLLLPRVLPPIQSWFKASLPANTTTLGKILSLKISRFNNLTMVKMFTHQTKVDSKPPLQQIQLHLVSFLLPSSVYQFDQNVSTNFIMDQATKHFRDLPKHCSWVK